MPYYGVLRPNHSGYASSSSYSDAPYQQLHSLSHARPPSPASAGVFFPLGTPPEIVQCFQRVDRNRNGVIDERELQSALSTPYHPFCIRTVRLLMFLFDATGDAYVVGPSEFVKIWNCLWQWRILSTSADFFEYIPTDRVSQEAYNEKLVLLNQDVFHRFDRDGSGSIDPWELRDALHSLGYGVSPRILELLITKYQSTALDFDKFVECGLIVQGLTEKFKEKFRPHTGHATLSHDDFLLMVIPFIAC